MKNGFYYIDGFPLAPLIGGREKHDCLLILCYFVFICAKKKSSCQKIFSQVTKIDNFGRYTLPLHKKTDDCKSHQWQL